MTTAPTVRSSSVNTGDGVSTVTVTKPSGTVDGDYLVAWVHCDADATAANLTAPAGWAQNGSTQTVANVGVSKVFTKAASGEGASYVFGADINTSGVWIVAAITGHNPGSPINIAITWSSSTTAGQSSQVAPSIITTVANSLLLCTWACGASSTASYTPASGMTELKDSWSGFQFASVDSLAVASAGATGTKTATATSGGNGWISGSMAIAPAPDPTGNKGGFFAFLQ